MRTEAFLQATAIREYFQRKYGDPQPPATESEVLRIEENLGIYLPPILRELYLQCNGFLGPLGARYLAPLFGEGITVIELSEMIRYKPAEDVVGFIAFGENAAFHTFAMRESEPDLRIVYIDPEAPKFIDLGNNLFQVYLKDEKKCHEDTGGEIS